MRFVYSRSRNTPTSGPASSILPRVEASITPDASPHREAFALDRVVHRLAREREVPRAPPLPDVLEHGAALDVPLVHRRRADRIEQRRSSVDAGEHGVGHGRVRRPAVRRTLRAGARAPRLVHDRGGQHAARAPLVDRRADVGRALHVLGRAQIVPDGLEHVGDGRVALQVDEVLPEVVGRRVPVRHARREPRPMRPPRSRATVGRRRPARSRLVRRPSAARRRCDRQSWVAGFQPPETSRRSASRVSSSPSEPATLTVCTLPSPSAADTALPVRTSRPAARAASVAGPPAPGSTIAATSSPARVSAIADSCPAWFVLKTTARSPASTPKRSA